MEMAQILTYGPDALEAAHTGIENTFTRGILLSLKDFVRSFYVLYIDVMIVCLNNFQSSIRQY